MYACYGLEREIDSEFSSSKYFFTHLQFGVEKGKSTDQLILSNINLTLYYLQKRFYNYIPRFILSLEALTFLEESVISLNSYKNDGYIDFCKAQLEKDNFKLVKSYNPLPVYPATPTLDLELSKLPQGHSLLIKQYLFYRIDINEVYTSFFEGVKEMCVSDIEAFKSQFDREQKGTLIEIKRAPRPSSSKKNK